MFIWKLKLASSVFEIIENVLIDKNLSDEKKAALGFDLADRVHNFPIRSIEDWRYDWVAQFLGYGVEKEARFKSLEWSINILKAFHKASVFSIKSNSNTLIYPDDPNSNFTFEELQLLKDESRSSSVNFHLMCKCTTQAFVEMRSLLSPDHFVINQAIELSGCLKNLCSVTSGDISVLHYSILSYFNKFPDGLLFDKRVLNYLKIDESVNPKEKAKT